MIMTSERLLTVEEVAEWLSVATRKVMDLARGNELPGFKVGKEWRFSRDEVASYLEAQRNKPQQSSSATS
jgi:excisionase family DNA binding protein